MKCSRCQHDNREGRRFCSECGASLAVTCPACNFANEPGEKFCGGCGASLGAATAATTGSRFTSPESYTPRHLADRILTSKAALEGERKQVTVLFADLKGSMELLAGRDPEEARKILDAVVERMMEAVHRYEGTVNQVMGDGIMALFGAPLAHEDHAVRACYAALRMQESVNQYAEAARRAHGVTVQIRVGLNSGEVVVRAIGNDLHMDYSAIGETTHLAARMEQSARPGTVLITPATMHLVEGFVAMTSLGPMPVKGRTEPVEVYEVSGVGPPRTRIQAAALRGLTRFVGRDSEIDLLCRSLKKAGAGSGHIVAIVGEAGVGKSRLTWEFTRSHHVQGWLVLRSRSLFYARGTPYLHVIDLLRAYLRLEDGDDPSEIRERLTNRLLILDRTLRPLLTPLLALFGVPIEDAAWLRLDPPQRRQRIFESLKRLLLRESEVQPLLLLFADLHWIDSESQALLDALIDTLPTARILLLLSYRPEYQHAWGNKRYYTELRIDPLPPESADELLSALLGADQTLEPVKGRLIERAQGNPFFLEESVQTLVETGVLVGNRGAYHMTTVPNEWPIPATAQAMVAARIDRLPAEDKRVLQAASIIGRDVPFTLLQAIADMPKAAVHRALAHLEASDFIYEMNVLPDLEYTFKHALTHDVAYAGVLHDRRRALHARIVEVLEALYPDRLNDHIERLAHHAFRGEVWEKAVTYLRKAGARALAHSAYREAVICFEQALSALHALPDTRQKVECAIDLRLDLRQALFPLGQFATVWRYLQEAEGFARTLDDPRRFGWVSAYMSGHHLHTGGEVAEGRTLAQRVHTIAEQLGDVPLHMAAQYYLVVSSNQGGDYRATEELCRNMIRSLPDDRSRERFGLVIPPALMARTALVHALAERGAFDEGDVQGREAIRIAEELDHALSILWGCIELAYLKTARGELSDAVPLLERALHQSQEWNITSHMPIALALLGHVSALSGRSAAGVSWLEEASAAYDSAGIGVYHSLSVERLGEAYLLADRVESARAAAERAMTLACDRGEHACRAWTLRLLGDIAAHGASPEVTTAVAHYDAAMTLASELDMRPLVAHCHRRIGALSQRTAEAERAKEHFKIAAAMYREMGMHFWLKQAEASRDT